MKKLCIIPARGGSKRLPGKNIKSLNGKPLIFHTIDAVLKSNLFDKIIFSSDEDEIIAIVRAGYNQTNLEIDKRPTNLASDTSKVIDTVMYYYYRDVFDTLDGSNKYNQVWLTLPTCPLRTALDICNAHKLLTQKINSVVSITDVEFPPTLSLNKNSNGQISSWQPSKPWEKGDSRSQDHPLLYRPNGAVYGAWSEKLEIFKNFYTPNTQGYYMPRSRSVDIDTEFDFKLASELLT